MSESEVLIVGGGTVGLSAAVFLAHHGVRVHLVESAAGPQLHPRATGVGMRTVELLREVGLDRAVNEAAVDMAASTLGKISTETLAAAALPALPVQPAGVGPATQPAFTPAALRGTCPQNRLDAVLLSAARERGARVEYGTELLSFEQDAQGVTARLGDGRTIRSQYLVAADGVRSQVRSALGIASSGPGNLGEVMTNTLFRADLRELTGPHGFVACQITHPQAPGMLVTIDGAKEWVLHTGPDHRPTPDFIRTALGAPDLDVEILSSLPWRVRALVADRFADGRVFLVGDAAHAIPPLGAFGMNTGIADAHNLAWKLAFVLRGQAGPALLDSYAAERRPVAQLAMEQSVLRLADPSLHWERGPQGAEARAKVGAVNAPIVHLGYRYSSAAVIEASPELPSTEDVSLALDGSAGSRMPHAWVADGVSTLDLIASRFTLFTAEGGAGADWIVAAERLGLAAHGVDLPQLPPGGALLVRPDGFVGWRAARGQAQQLPAALAALLSVSTPG
ncbi:FAD-dependent monooxygenase [Kitasatospora sp. McL0602]|uniref:FAD-dependent monooxygenase n=1 Tax=Kitasatospora sp. McL0602 TaxID=3439530 RepID=UPI003F8A3BB1